MKRMFVVALVAFTFFAQSSAAAGGKDDVTKAEQTFFDARTKGDKAAFASLLADEFTWGTTNGRFTTKEQEVEKLKAGPNPESGTPEIRMYGNDAAVVVTAATTATGPRKIVRVWTKRNGKWQILMHQSYLVPPYPAT
jgi:hypothetical protein